jgi:hypothetical protein
VPGDPASPPDDAAGAGHAPSDRTRVRRKAERGRYDAATVAAVLDAGLVCHVGFTDGGATYVVPMVHVRVGDALYVHGATGNRTLRSLADGATACVTVTLVDALVLSRAAFHHSMNYRSVMVLGRATRVTDPAEQRLATAALLDHLAPGRSAEARPPTDAELQKTMFLRIPLDEASAKVRTGGPVEDPGDLALGLWGGQIPLTTLAGTPVPDEAAAGLPLPPSVTSYRPPANQ